MALLVMVVALLATLGYTLFLVPPVTKAAKEQTSAELVAAAMLVTQKAAVDWCLRTTCLPPNGVIDPSVLILPPGYSSLDGGWLVATADGSRVSTYAVVASPQSPGGLRLDAGGIARRLGDLSLGGPSAGLAGANGSVVTRNAVQTVAVTALVPVGAPVVAQRVK